MGGNTNQQQVTTSSSSTSTSSSKKHAGHQCCSPYPDGFIKHLKSLGLSPRTSTKCSLQLPPNQQFNGSRHSYPSWADHMHSLLVLADLHGLVTGDLPRPDHSDHAGTLIWESMDRKSTACILLGIAPEVGLPDSEGLTSRQLWDHIRSTFFTFSREASLAAQLRWQLRSLKRGNFDSVHALVNEMQRLQAALRVLGRPISDEQYCDALLAAVHGSDPHVLFWAYQALNDRERKGYSYADVTRRVIGMLYEREGKSKVKKG